MAPPSAPAGPTLSRPTTARTPTPRSAGVRLIVGGAGTYHRPHSSHHCGSCEILTVPLGPPRKRLEPWRRAAQLVAALRPCHLRHSARGCERTDRATMGARHKSHGDRETAHLASKLAKVMRPQRPSSASSRGRPKKLQMAKESPHRTAATHGCDAGRGSLLNDSLADLQRS